MNRDSTDHVFTLATLIANGMCVRRMRYLTYPMASILARHRNMLAVRLVKVLSELEPVDNALHAGSRAITVSVIIPAGAQTHP